MNARQTLVASLLLLAITGSLHAQAEHRKLKIGEARVATLTDSRLVIPGARLLPSDRPVLAHRWQVALESKTWVNVEIRSTDLEPLLLIRDAKGRVLLEELQGGNALNPRMAWELDPDTPVEILVVSRHSHAGSYRISVLPLSVNDGGPEVDSNTICRIHEEALETDEDPLLRAWRLSVLASMRSGFKHRDQARTRVEEALEIRSKRFGPTSFETALSLFQRGEVQAEFHDYDEAASTYSRAIEILEEEIGADHPTTLQASGLRAWNAYQLGRYPEAERRLRAVLAGYERAIGRIHPLVAHLLTKLALSIQRQGRYSEVEPIYERELGITRALFAETSEKVTRGMNNLATLWLRQARYKQAEPLLRDVLRIRIDNIGENNPSTADALFNLGYCMVKQGKFSEAEAFYLRANRIDRSASGPDHPTTAAGIANIARICEYQGRLEDAERYLREALAVLEEAWKENPSLSGYQGSLARVLSRQGRVSEAEAILRKCVSRLETLAPKQMHMAEVSVSLAEILRKRGEYGAAKALLVRALDINREILGARHHVTAENVAELGRCALAAGDADTALRHFNEALAVWTDEAGVPDARIEALLDRGRAHLAASNAEAALLDLEEGAQVAESLRPEASGAARGQSVLFSRFAHVYELAVAILADQGRVADAFAMTERARARAFLDQLLLARIDVREGLSAAERKTLTRQEAEVGARLAELNGRIAFERARKDGASDERAKNVALLQGELRKARSQYESLWGSIRSKSALVRTALTPRLVVPSLDRIRAEAIRPDAVLLSYFVGRTRSWLTILPGRDGKVKMVELTVPESAAKKLGVPPGSIGNAALRDIVVRVLRSLRRRGAAKADTLSALSSIVLPSSARAAWRKEGVTRVIAVPSGAMRTLPLEMLTVESGRTVLEDAPGWVYAPSATALVVASSKPKATPERKDRPVLTVGAPVFDPTRAPRSGTVVPASDVRRSDPFGGRLPPPLPWAARESDRVVHHFGAERCVQLKGVAATEPAVRAALSGRRILHLATHGVVDQDGANLFGALLFTPPEKITTNRSRDGRLTLSEIYSLPLAGCELAILSACQTLAGPTAPGDPAFTLTRGFLVAGVECVLATHWRVEDASAAALVEAFTARVTEAVVAGRRPDYAAALREAKLTLSRGTRFPEPYSWAGFVLVGRP